MPLSLFVLLPLFALVSCCLFPNRFEKSISGIAVTSMGVTSLLFAWMVFLWGKSGFAPIFQPGPLLFSRADYELSIHFYMDTNSVVFFGTACLATLLVLLFSKYYMHRDPGFRRFYATILFFFAGIALIIFSGNLETLFIGWEWIGISSFLLIAFYRERFLPTKNALKVFSLYRIADAILIIALWYAHHLFEGNISFAQIPTLINTHGNALTILGVLFLIVAMIKSAQFPFSYWLPRAIEGPTTSSAIFYGALSVHIGLFLLLRTFPFWEGSTWLRGGIIFIGVATALVATSITRVQSSIKTQIAYASVTQIGVMFVEIATGLHGLALFHFVSNACLRTYQLLVSPSILSYLIHHQFYAVAAPEQKIQRNFIGKIRSTLFTLGIKEWNMDSVMTYFVWQPLKRVGKWVAFLDTSPAMITAILILLSGGYVIFTKQSPPIIFDGLTLGSGILSLFLFVRAYASKGAALTAWTQIFLGQLFSCLFLSLFSGADARDTALYFVPTIGAYLVGVLLLTRFGHHIGRLPLMDFHGKMYKYPLLGSLFFITCLAMMLFPITPSFLGEELLLSMTPTDLPALIAVFALGYVFSGICVMRLFAKLFFGPHQKSYHEVAYRSS